jgi:hypothetical protein
MTRDRLLFDTWTPMSFKAAIGGRKQPGITWEEPTWVGDHARRLAAYKVLRSYIDNAAREFLAIPVGADQDKADHREYGDAALLVDTILTALLGDNQKIVVQEAADYSPPNPGDNTGGTDAGNKTGDDPPGAIGKDSPEVAAAWKFQEWLRKQWKDERGALKVVETERNAVGLGDGVYSLGWSPKKRRARIRVWDPGFFYPVLADRNDDDFPERVHIAYEYCEPNEPTKTYIRRLTWELVTVPPWTPAYAESGDDPATQTCLYTDATWEASTDGRHVDDFDPGKATYANDENGTELRGVNLQLDFIPVVHIPNTVAIQPFFGRSSLSSVLQILDDLANSDTDAQAASATAAKPVMALEGGTLGRTAPEYRPGDVFEVGDGKLTLIDTSKALDAILKAISNLIDRLTVNARTPDALLGRVKPSEVPSGIAMVMSFGPLAAMIGEMRLSRAEKYPILLKMLWRINKVGKSKDVPPKYYDSELRLGSFLPQDKAAAVTMIKDLMNVPGAPPISMQTAVAMLMAQGFPIEDATEEVRRIQSQDFTGADNLRTATGSQEIVFKYLHVEKPSDAVPPQPNVAGTLGAGAISGDPATDPNATQNQTKPSGQNGD